MNIINLKKGILSVSFIKIIALVSMTIDHIGVILLNNYLPFRIVGRISFPLFAFMIAEGTKYTKNKTKYLLRLLIIGLICQLAYFIFEKSLYQCVFITFSLSIAIIYCIDFFEKNKDRKIFFLIPLFSILTVYFVCNVLPNIFNNTDFYIDYGFCGVLFSVLVSFGKDLYTRKLLFIISTILLSMSIGGIQWFSLLAVPLILMYNGKKGKLPLKYFFYIYYPLHLAVLYLISMI